MADILRILIKNGVVWDYIKYAPFVIKRGVLECIAQGGKCFPAAGGYTERVYAAIFCGMLKALIRNGGANAANIAGSIEFAPAKIIKAEQQSSPIRLLLDIHGRNAVFKTGGIIPVCIDKDTEQKPRKHAIMEFTLVGITFAF